MDELLQIPVDKIIHFQQGSSEIYYILKAQYGVI
jgi:hypothetical protein